MATPGRRNLRYNSLDEVMPDVERLLAGHTTVGKWSLAQICANLATTLRFSVDQPASTERDLSRYVTAQQRQSFLEAGVLDEKRPIPDDIPICDAFDDRHEAEALREALSNYAVAPGPVMSHARLGSMTRADWDRFHCVHFAHHLSFAIPK